MSYWILTEAGWVIAHTTVQCVTNLELMTDEVKQQCNQFTQRVTELINYADHIIPHGNDAVLQDWNDYPLETDPDFIDEFQNVVPDDKVPEQDDNFTPDTFNNTYLKNIEVALPRGGADDLQFAKVTKWFRDKNGHPIRTANDNLMLDTHEYDVEFLDGHRELLSANTIAQHIFSQVNEVGHQHLFLDDIVDYRRDDSY